MIGGEDFFALWIPVLVGDGGISLSTRIGRRVPLILAATGLALPALILTPLARFQAGIALATLFIAYFAYFSPYHALFPNLVANKVCQRSQDFQRTFSLCWRLGSVGRRRPPPQLVGTSPFLGHDRSSGRRHHHLSGLSARPARARRRRTRSENLVVAGWNLDR